MSKIEKNGDQFQKIGIARIPGPDEYISVFSKTPLWARKKAKRGETLINFLQVEEVHCGDRLWTTWGLSLPACHYFWVYAMSLVPNMGTSPDVLAQLYNQGHFVWRWASSVSDGLSAPVSALMSDPATIESGKIPAVVQRDVTVDGKPTEIVALESWNAEIDLREPLAADLDLTLVLWGVLGKIKFDHRRGPPISEAELAQLG